MASSSGKSHVIIRNVDRVPTLDGLSVEGDQRVRARLDYALDMLEVYAEALTQARSDERLAAGRYTYGM